MHKHINRYNYLSKITYCTRWHINSPEILLCLCVWFFSSFVNTCICVLLHKKSPLRRCRSIQSGASGLPYYCAPLVCACVSDVMELLAVWQHNKQKTKGGTYKNGGRMVRSSKVARKRLARIYSWTSTLRVEFWVKTDSGILTLPKWCFRVWHSRNNICFYLGLGTVGCCRLFVLILLLLRHQINVGPDPHRKGSITGD